MTKTQRNTAWTTLALLAAIVASFVTKTETPESTKSIELEADYVGQVLTVADGDTIILKVDGERIKVRLQGIDCPERDQPFGKEAGEFVRDHVLDREVEVRSLGKDQYDRVLGEVSINGKNLNKELLRNGYAWWYERHARDRDDYRDLQQEAREAERGLWSDSDAMPPWEFRRNQREGR